MMAYSYDRTSSSVIRWRMGELPAGGLIWTSQAGVSDVYEQFRVKPDKEEWALTYTTKAQQKIKLEWRRLRRTFKTPEEAQEFAEQMVRKPLKQDVEEASKAVEAPDVTKPLREIRRAIKAIYGESVSDRTVYVSLPSDFEPKEKGRVEKLRRVVDHAVPAKGKSDKGDPLLVISVQGNTPYSGYSVTITTNEHGVAVQRFPTANEFYRTGRDPGL